MSIYDAEQLKSERLEELLDKYNLDQYMNNDWQNDFERFFKENSAMMMGHFIWLENQNKELRKRVDLLEYRMNQLSG